MTDGADWLPDIMLARHDVAATYLPDYFAWYADRHGPDAIEMGHFTARNYLCVDGSPLMCNVYENAGVADIWYAPSYQAIRTRDDLRAEVLGRITRKSNTGYAQVVTLGVPTQSEADWRAGKRQGSLGAPCITTFEFDHPDPLVVEGWYRDGELPRLGTYPGFRSGRLCRRHGPLHPDTPSGEPEWVAVCEWDDRQSAGGPGLHTATIERHTAALGDGLRRASYCRALLVSAYGA